MNAYRMTCNGKHLKLLCYRLNYKLCTFVMMYLVFKS